MASYGHKLGGKDKNTQPFTITDHKMRQLISLQTTCHADKQNVYMLYASEDSK